MLRATQVGTRAVVACAALALAYGAQAATAQTLDGQVRDPQQRVIVGARVEMTCRDVQVAVRTDAQGRFRLSIPPEPGTCTVSVTHPGFAVFSEPVWRRSEPWLIDLPLAAVRERVQVEQRGGLAARTDWANLGTVSLTDGELRAISNDARDWLGYAKALAGVSSGRDQIYVDGLRSQNLPPPELIADIQINADPFSAEYTAADHTQIDITTRSPDRQLRFSFGGATVGAGGSSVLAADLDKRSRSGNVTLTGPVPLGPDPPDALLRLMRGTIAEHHCEKSALAEPTVG